MHILVYREIETRVTVASVISTAGVQETTRIIDNTGQESSKHHDHHPRVPLHHGQ